MTRSAAALLAVIHSALTPPASTGSHLTSPALGNAENAAAIAARNRVLTGVLQPAAIDLLNPAAGATLGNRAWLLAIRAGGNTRAVDRYERELAPLADGVALENERQETLWRHIEEFTPRFLATHPDGAVVRTSCTLKELEGAISSCDGPALARAGSGVCYAYFPSSGGIRLGPKAVIEFSPEAGKRTLDLWPAPGGDFEIMQRVKNLFDPANLLNRGRLYRRI